MMLFSSAADVFTIGIIVPFISILIAPDDVLQIDLLRTIFSLLGAQTSQDILVLITVLFCSAVVLAGTIRILLTYLQYRVAFSLGAELSSIIFRRTLYQPYTLHLVRNSSSIVSGITIKSTALIFSAIYPVVIITSSLITVFAVFGSLLYISPGSALICLFGGAAVYFFVARTSFSILSRDGTVVNQLSSQVVKMIQEAIGSIRHIITDGTQELYSSRYQALETSLKDSMARIQLVSTLPRFLIESVGIVLVAVVALYLASLDGGVGETIPILGALALGAQRMLPVIQQAYSNWSALVSGRATVSETLALLEQDAPVTQARGSLVAVPFRESIELRNVSFSYKNSGSLVLDKVHVRIQKGAKVGVFGESGSGKSTLLDIVNGLLTPTEGNLLVDGRIVDQSNVNGWRSHLAHVPQAVYLQDATVRENIALGHPQELIDMPRVIEAATRAQIATAIDAFPLGYETRVGERGVMLSGGQCQRLALARAFYKGASVLILDEATNALDTAMEEKVIEHLRSLGGEVTVLMVTHRLSTLKHCSLLIEIESGRVKNVGTYNELFS